MPSIPELASSSSFIFTGTVVEHGTSRVPAVPPNLKLVVVRLDSSLRVDPVLGDLRGKMITVAANAPESLLPGQKAVFFANSWIHGRGIAVREIDHIDIGEEKNVATAVALLPQIHLQGRLQHAELVVDAEVVSISPAEKSSHDRKTALWVTAHLNVHKVIYGKAQKSTVVCFPTAEWPPWTQAPRFKKNQRGIFILHTPAKNATMSEATLEAGNLVALDPADFQPESKLPEVEKLLAALKQTGRRP